MFRGQVWANKGLSSEGHEEVNKRLSKTVPEQGKAQTKALELAEYIQEITDEIDRVLIENKALKQQYLDNLTNRFDKTSRKTNSLFVMSMFMQWKVCTQNSQFQKELAEAEGTFKDEKSGYEDHVNSLETTLDTIAKRNAETREQVLNNKMEAEDLQRRVLEIKRRCDTLRDSVATQTTFINSVRLKVDAYKPRFKNPQEQPFYPTSGELDLMVKEMHTLLSRVDPNYVKPVPGDPLSNQKTGINLSILGKYGGGADPRAVNANDRRENPTKEGAEEPKGSDEEGGNWLGLFA